MDRIRHFFIHLVKAGVLAVANEVAAWEAQARGRVMSVEIFLGNIGAVSGSTTVDIKKNGTSILTAPISIAFNAATKRTRVTALAGMLGEPSGVDFVAGDYFQVNITAIPGTASQDLTAYLHCAKVDE
jgi:hypothetical protein